MRLRMTALHSNPIVSAVVDAVFPPRCAGCGHRGVWVCDECRPSITLLSPPWCARCGIPDDSRCRCDELSPSVDASRSAAVYSGWIRRAIHLVKYESEPARVSSLADLMVPAARALAEFDALVPVPLHVSRHRRRGYNQAHLLARDLSSYLDRPLYECLRRTRSTGQQVGRTADDRRQNVAGAFVVEPNSSVSGRRLLLIDDVMTTGSTFNACADVLRASGAEWVGALSIAREI